MTEERVSGWNLDHTYTQLPKMFFDLQQPVPVNAPEIVVLNDRLAASLGLDAEALKEDVKVFAGNEVPDGTFPLAQAYAGHQFGNFTMLGDGRAVLIGEHLTPKGELVDIQLKGAGRTKYSRGGDGRAALGPMLREYIMSEAMHGLGIPTTRSLTVTSTGDAIIREKKLQGAILTRVAASHIRVGTFQYAAQWGELEDLRQLADYAINRHYPAIKQDENPYHSLLKEVIKRQTALITKWQLVGFIHGVMNTDNMTISGETIDYGPCAFMDTYHPETVFSSIDHQGRYAYMNQPYICGWNLARFAEALIPLLHMDEKKAIQIAQDEISHFSTLYQQQWYEGMRAKLGLFQEEEEDKTLIDHLLGLMQKHAADYTNTFRALTHDKIKEEMWFQLDEFQQWYKRWQDRLERQGQSKEAVYELMKKSNPAVIPRNHRVEEALDAAVDNGDYHVMERLLAVLQNPFAHNQEQEEYYLPPSPTAEPYQTYCGT
ncbi:YdiU family protein [Cytobacillus spongiae]|uniref:protein adenylyltransferase SelO n=1 Tax=Cytobacillus spongiae TaxID=2901381 RepID=UPI001F2AF529|nr:YdiU family protein [Cytobacillus spongiae]UII56433.1 YdiU family protein [Cytobacillus spongiae]